MLLDAAETIAQREHRRGAMLPLAATHEECRWLLYSISSAVSVYDETTDYELVGHIIESIENALDGQHGLDEYLDEYLTVWLSRTEREWLLVNFAG